MFTMCSTIKKPYTPLTILNLAFLLHLRVELVEFLIFLMVVEQLLFDQVEVGDLLDDGAAQAGEVLQVLVGVRLLALNHAEIELLRWWLLLLPERN